MTDSTAGLDARIVLERSETFTLDIELTIAPGTTAALLGPNGSGKSTSVAALAGIEAIDEGHIRLGERTLDAPSLDVFQPAHERRIGVVFQDYLLFDHMDVTDNVGFGAAATGMSRRAAREAAQRWLTTLGLNDLAGRSTNQLSGGQAQRVAVARALASEPDLLLLDEPLAALDVETRTHLRRALADHLATYAGPRLLITHDPTDAFLLADQIHILEAGRITQTGSPSDIRSRPATPYVAALAGLNLLTGSNDRGTLKLDGYQPTLASADTHTTGSVLITIRPNAIALHGEEPHGSPRNSWLTSIATLEPLGDITRVMLADPLPLSVDITPAAAQAMNLRPGSEVWASIKATEIVLNHS